MIATQIPSPDTRYPFAFALVPQEERQLILGKINDADLARWPVFFCNDEASIRYWMKSINDLQFRRIKSIVFLGCEELRRERSGSNEQRILEEGLFRVPGSTKVLKIPL